MAADDQGGVEARQSEQRLLTALVADLRGSDRLTPPELVRLDRVRLLLAARGIALRDPRAALWLAPVICTSASQQSRFLERFAMLFDVPVETLRPAPPEPPVVAETPRPPWWRRHARLLALAAAAAALVAWLVWTASRRESQAPAGTVTLRKMVQVLSGDSPAAGAPSTAVAWLAVAAAALALLALLAAAHRLWRRARKAREPDEFEPGHLESRSLAFAAALPRLYASPRLRHRLGGLRRHRIMPSPRIHVRRSIRATIKAGGRPVLIHGTRPVTPDYVLLADRESPRDHLPVVAQILSKRFSEEGVAAAAYEYFGDPRRVRRIFPVPEDSELSIERVASRHGGARLLLLAEPADCLDPSGRAAPWLADLPEERPVLLDPRRESCWDWREEEIAAAGVRVFPASPAGIGDYADAIQARADGARGLRRHSPGGRVDLPALLDRHRDSLISETAPEEGEIRDLLDDLEQWLGAEAMVVLRAAALFPLVEPSLTTLLASRLVDGEGRALLTEERLLALARLPWLRIGRIPAWLRGPLVRGLSADQLAVARSTIHAFLNPVQDGPKGRLKLDFAQSDDPAARERLLDWLRRNPLSPYGDGLLVDAVAGRPPDQLGLELEPEPLHRVREALRKIDPPRDGVALMLSGVAAVALAVLMPAREAAVGPQEPPPIVRTKPEVVQADTDEAEATPGAEAPEPGIDDRPADGKVADPARVEAPPDEYGLDGVTVTRNAVANAMVDSATANAMEMLCEGSGRSDPICQDILIDPSTQPDVPEPSAEGVEVLHEQDISGPDQLEGVMMALDQAVGSFASGRRAAGERLEILIYLKSTRAIWPYPAADRMAELAREALAKWKLPQDVATVRRVNANDQRDRSVLSVQIITRKGPPSATAR